MPVIPVFTFDLLWRNFWNTKILQFCLLFILLSFKTSEMSRRPALRDRDRNIQTVQGFRKSLQEEIIEKSGQSAPISTKLIQFRNNDKVKLNTIKKQEIKSPKFNIFTDKIKQFTNEPEDLNLKKRKIHELNLHNVEDAETNNENDMQNFKFRLDPTVNDPSSLLYKCQIPLIKLNDFYNITQFQIVNSNENKDSTIFQILKITEINELIKLITVDKMQCFLICYKQSPSNYKKFQDLKIGDLIEISDDDNDDDKAIKCYYNWRLIL